MKKSSFGKNKRGKKRSKNKKNRNIPSQISNAVKQRHFFECAWCGMSIYERHHIKEFHLGGAHTEGNLILLCPNHHTMAHNGEINREELEERKSTHKKGDRLTGDFKTTANELVVNLCGGKATNTPNLICNDGYPILRIYNLNGNILIDAKFYNKEGFLVFWMSRSMFWSLTNAEISQPKIDFLEIKNSNESIYLKVYKNTAEEALNVEMSTYLRGRLIKFNENYGNFSNNIFKTLHLKDNNIFINYRSENPQ